MPCRRHLRSRRVNHIRQCAQQRIGQRTFESKRTADQAGRRTIVAGSLHTADDVLVGWRVIGRRNLTFTEIELFRQSERLTELIARSDRRTVPQIFIDGVHVGGYDDLLHIDLPVVEPASADVVA